MDPKEKEFYDKITQIKLIDHSKYYTIIQLVVDGIPINVHEICDPYSKYKDDRECTPKLGADSYCMICECYGPAKRTVT